MLAALLLVAAACAGGEGADPGPLARTAGTEGPIGEPQPAAPETAPPPAPAAATGDIETSAGGSTGGAAPPPADDPGVTPAEADTTTPPQAEPPEDPQAEPPEDPQAEPPEDPQAPTAAEAPAPPEGPQAEPPEGRQAPTAAEAPAPPEDPQAEPPEGRQAPTAAEAPAPPEGPQAEPPEGPQAEPPEDTAAAGAGSEEPAGDVAAPEEPPGRTTAEESEPDDAANDPAADPETPRDDPNSPEPGGTGSGSDPGTRGTLEFAGCGQAYLCATLAVPADHDDPDGPAVDLAIGMLPAGDPSQRVGYLLANPGGPGGGMTGFLDFGAGLSPYLLERFDVVGWDPRGVGGSVPSGCWVKAIELHLVDPLPGTPDERALLDETARALAEECVAQLGDMVAHIGTIDTVRDIDAIRRALGAETISYIGFSYGTLLGLHYAGMFGEHLRAAVLDGVADPSLSALEHAVGQMAGFDRSVEDMFAWCRSAPSCAVTGDPAETYYGLLEQVDQNPLTDAAGGVVLGPARTVLAATFATYSSTLWPAFFQFLAAAAEGDGTMLGRVGEAYTALADLGAFVSINCTDSGAVTRAEIDVLTAAAEEVAGALGRASVISALPCEHCRSPTVRGPSGRSPPRRHRRSWWSATGATMPRPTSGPSRWPGSSNRGC